MNKTQRPVRPPLEERLIAAMQRTEAWVANETTARVTLYENGVRQEPAMMTRQEVEEWQAARLPVETYSLIEELTYWAGRNAANAEETEKVKAVRRRAESVLQARQTATV